MDVKRVQYTPKTRVQEQEQIIHFLDETLRSDKDFSVKEEYPSLFGEFPGGQSFYVKMDGRIVSHAALVVREFQHFDHRLKIGMVGSVTTAADFRGRGMAKAILSETVEDMHRQGCILGVLWSGQHEFYRPMGFFRAGREVDYRFSSESVPSVGETVRELDRQREIHLIWRLYQRHDVRVDRSLEEQKRLLEIPRTRVFVTEKDSKITSYIVVHKGADFENYIHEWGGEIEDVQANVAWVQKNVFPERNLTLIAPSHYDMSPFDAICLATWDGVLGLIKVLDRRKLIATYLNFLDANELHYEYHREEDMIDVMGEELSIKDDEGLVKAVLGDGGLTAHPVLPFFLWGLDSI